MIYLDSAATSLQKPNAVYQSAAMALRTMTSPGRGNHRATRLAAETAYRCREAAAALFSVPEPEQVVFTFNATHGLNIAVETLLRPGGKVVVSGFEHNAVMRPLYDRQAEITVAVDPQEPFAVPDYGKYITRETELAVFNHVSNVYGCRQDLDALSDVCKTLGVPLIVDASQSAGIEPIAFSDLAASFIAMPGHKGLYGPQGTGLLLCAEPGACLLSGGTGGDSANPHMPDYLPDRLEAGTHNMPGIAGLLAGLTYVLEKTPEKIAAWEHRLMAVFLRELRKIPGITLYAPKNADRSLVSFTVDGMDCEEVGDALSRRGIAVRTGLHCAPLAHRTGGTFETGTVRVSVSAFNRPGEMVSAASAVREIVRDKLKN